MRIRILLAALPCLIGISAALAQAPRTPAIPPAPPPTPPGQVAGANAPIVDPYLPLYTKRNVYRSRTAPYPEPRDPDNEYGFRNPGGIGRFSEYYPPGNQFQNGGRDPTRVAGFSQNIAPGTSRADQLAAQQAGIARMNEQDNRINALARPLGFGYGFGFGGFPY